MNLRLVDRRKLHSLHEQIHLQRLFAVDCVFDVGANHRSFTLSAFVPNNGGHFLYLIETDCIMIGN
jgi:hypothetical protein